MYTVSAILLCMISGNALLACPVTDPGVTKVKILLPGSDEVSLMLLNVISSIEYIHIISKYRFVWQLWYDVSSGKVHRGGRTLTLPVTLETVS